MPVQAEALKVVDEVVTPGDAREKFINLRGALFAGGVERVAHAGSLAQRRVEKSKPQKFMLPLVGAVLLGLPLLMDGEIGTLVNTT